MPRERGGLLRGAQSRLARFDPGAPAVTRHREPGAALPVCGWGCWPTVVTWCGSFTASFKALRRGEISEYTQLLEDSRRHAIDRMVENAQLMGADAIVAIRFDSSEIGGQFTEIVAYGTAVKAVAAE